jgi:excinuclease UvrABC nuclease subunit
MKNLTIKKCKENKALVPEKKGIYYFSQGDKLLFAGFSGNLQQRIDFFLHNEDPKLDWIQEATSVSYQEYDSFWQSLVQFKILLTKHTPEYQHKYRTTDQYAYLSLNYSEDPYLFVRETTEKDETYLGPFRTRFKLLDYIDSFKVLKQTKESAIKAVIPHDWYSYIQEFILNKPEEKLEKISSFINSLEDDLEFEKAEFWQERVDLIQDYYKELSMFISMKNLAFSWIEGKTKYTVEHGKLVSLENIETQQQTSFPITTLDYNENEMLAVDKTMIDEIWVIYRHLEKTQPEFLQEFIEKQWNVYREN